MMCSSRNRHGNRAPVKPPEAISSEEQLPALLAQIEKDETNMTLREGMRVVRRACSGCSYVDPSHSGHTWQRVQPGPFGDQCYTLEVSVVAMDQTRY